MSAADGKPAETQYAGGTPFFVHDFFASAPVCRRGSDRRGKRRSIRHFPPQAKMRLAAFPEARPEKMLKFFR
jgi:hypothetical protein